MPTVTIEDRRLLDPTHPDARMPWLDSRSWAVMVFVARCAHGCRTVVRQQIGTDLVTDRAVFQMYADALPDMLADMHVCMRKAPASARV